MEQEFLVGGTTCTKFTSKLKRKDKGKKKRKGKQKRKRKTEKKIEKKTEKRKTEQKREKGNQIWEVLDFTNVRSIFLQKIRIMFQIYDLRTFQLRATRCW